MIVILGPTRWIPKVALSLVGPVGITLATFTACGGSSASDDSAASGGDGGGLDANLSDSGGGGIDGSTSGSDAAADAGAPRVFDYYIGPNGSDSDPGTIASPWAISAINTKRTTYAGKGVGLIDGTYDVLKAIGGSYSSSADSFSTPALMIAGGLGPSQRTVIGAVHLRAAILDGGGNGTTNPNGQPLIGTLSPIAGLGYITIDGIDIRDNFNRLVSIGAETGAPFSGTRLLGIEVKNNWVHQITNTLAGTNPTAITLYSSDGALVQNNLITEITDTTNRGTGIEIWTSVNSVTELNSVISPGSGCTSGILHKNASQQNNTIRYNFVDMTLSGASGVGATLDSDGDGTTTSSIYGNIFVADNPLSPSAIDTGNFPSSLNKQVIYGNTFVGIPGWSVGGVIRYGAASTITAYDNIFSRSTVGGRGEFDTSASAPALIDFNCYPAMPDLGLTTDGAETYPGTLTSSLTTWGTMLPAGTIGKDTHSVTADPKFVATGSRADAYRLQATSPCANVGSKTGAAGGAATDIGAWGNGTTRIGSDF